MAERRPWSADQSENALLAIALQDPSAVDEALALRVSADDFGAFQRAVLWKGMVDDRRRGVGPDEATVLERHERNIGPGRPFRDFSELALVVKNLGRVPSRRENLERYVESIKEYRSRRTFWLASRRITALYEDGESSSEMAGAAEKALRGTQDQASGELVLAGDLVRAAAAKARKVRDGEEEDEQLLTGLGSLDAVLRYHPGHYGIIAGRPGMGKTQLALGIAGGIAASHGPVLFCSVEMRGDSLGHRLYSSSYQEESRSPDPHAEPDPDAVDQRAIAAWGDLPVYVDHKSRSLSDVLAAVRIAKRKYGIVAFVVDYLQKMKLPEKQSREQEIASASEALSHAAGSMGVCAIVLSQLNRGVDSRPNKRPMPSDLRESGSLEQDADSILFVYRDSVYNRRCSTPEKAELILEKQRNGRAHVTIPAYFKPGDGFFRDWRTRPNIGAGDVPGWGDE